MASIERDQPGIYWQSLMGNNGDGIGGNCHRYDVVTGARPDGQHGWFLVDYGVKFGAGRKGYAAEFASPEGLLVHPGEGGGPEALLLTHAHEDHLGAVRHLLHLGYRCPPVYASAFTAAMLNKSLADAGVEKNRWPEIRIARTGETVEIAGARVSFVAMDHMPGATALHIASDQASVFHTGDYRFDATLPLGPRADPAVLRAIGQAGLDMVVSDSTAAPVTDAPVTEAEIAHALERIVADNAGRPVIAGILGSQLDRLVSLGRAAKANDRALVLSGRSLVANAAVAQAVGIDIEAAAGTPLLTTRQAAELPAEKVLVVTTGAFAQPNSGLGRASRNQPGALAITPDTMVVIAQREIPPVREAQAAMVARLEARGATVVTAERAVAAGYGPIHQSGHAVERDCRLLYTLLRPRMLAAPVHGNAAQITANGRLARSVGVPVLALDRNGAVVRVAPDGARVIGVQPPERIGARERTDVVRQLPKASPGQGRDSHFPVPVFSYDRLDDAGAVVLRSGLETAQGATRPKRPDASAAPRVAVHHTAAGREGSRSR